jgi:acyl-coenzyme A synthetase/AMP-(fatty) acid ligase
MEYPPGQELPFSSIVNSNFESNPITLLVSSSRKYPDKLLLDSALVQATYNDVMQMTLGLADKLKRYGVQSGQLVALDFPSPLHFPFMFATFYLGAISCAYSASEFQSAGVTPDWLFTLNSRDPIEASRVVQVDSDFISEASAFQGWFPPVKYEHTTSPCILFLSSGTTGKPKPTKLSASNLMGRSAQIARLMFSQPYMSLLDVSAYVGLTTFFAQMILGETYIIPGSASDNLEAIHRREVRYVQGSAQQFTSLVKAILLSPLLPPKTVEAIQVVGSHMPIILRNQLNEILDCEVHTRYGTTEGGLVSFRLHNSDNPCDSGYVVEGVRIEIVLDDETVAEYGQEGSIRYQGPFTSINDAIGHPISNDALQADEWFYPGDRGTLLKDGQLFITGRDDETINFGGQKVNLGLVDEYVLNYENVADAASFAILEKSPNPQLAVAIVGSVDFLSLEKLLFSKFNQKITFKLIKVESVPRTKMGKPMRNFLTQQFTNK